MLQAYSLAHNTREGPFAAWEKDPSRAKQFGDAMNFLHSDAGFDPAHLVSGYDFASLGQATFVDVGGSHGQVSIPVAQRYPNLRCIVQDLPTVIATGEAQLPADVKDRVTFMAHDFWTKQPVMNADVFYLRWVLHDWPDSLAVKILQQLIPSLKKGAKVLIDDICMPPPKAISLYQERWIRLVAVSLTMLWQG